MIKPPNNYSHWIIGVCANIADIENIPLHFVF